MALTGPSLLVPYFMSLCLLSLPLSSATTYILGGSTGWTTGNYSAWAASHTLHVGDILVFRCEPQRHNVYIFHHRRAFHSCNFTDATLLDRGYTGYFKWVATQPGIFYFSCNGPTEKGNTAHCQKVQKVAVRVYGKLHEVFHSAAPGSSPAYAPAPSARRPKVLGHICSPATSPSRSPITSNSAGLMGSPSPVPVPMPEVLPNYSRGIPFITSNPALPLPKGETDAATIRPLPTSNVGGQVARRREIQMLLPLLLLYTVTTQ